MTIDRAHAAEDEYFRNQEADRQREGAWELQRIARVETAKLEEIEAGRVRQAARSTIITHRAPRAAQLLKNLESVTVSEIDIEDDAVVVRDEREHARLFSGVRDVNRVTIFGEDPSNERGNRLVVFSNQNANWRYLWSAPPSQVSEFYLTSLGVILQTSTNTKGNTGLGPGILI